MNNTGAAITIGVSDGSGAYIVPTQDVPPRGHLTIPLYGMPYTGPEEWVARRQWVDRQSVGRTAPLRRSLDSGGAGRRVRLATPVAAQTVTIRATDASTGADVQRVGDDTNDALRVTLVSPTTVPVSGTVAFSNSTIAVTGTFWQTTQPVSVASLPLPTGAATAAKQLPSARRARPSDVISVHGVVGGTTLPVSAPSPRRRAGRGRCSRAIWRTPPRGS